MSDLLPAVLLNALRQYKFAESPLWRMADGKDHVKIEVTFRKQTNQQFDKKGAESRRRPIPPAGEWPRQPAPARHPVTRPTPPASRQPTTPEKETTPPAQQTLQIDTATISVETTEDSTDHAFTYNTETSYTASFSNRRLQRSREPNHQRLQDSRRNTSMST